jgi:hypothetical protein
MAITYQSSVTKFSDFASSNTQALDVGSGSDRVLLVLATLSGAGTNINSATYAGTAMTAITAQIAGPDQGGGGAMQYRLFGLANPTSGSNNIVVTNSDGNKKPGMIALCYTGVDQTTPWDTGNGLVTAGTTGNTANFGNGTTTVASATGDLVALLLMHDSAVTFTAGTGTTLRQSGGPGFSQRTFGGDEAGAAAVIIGGTLSGSSWYLGAAINLNASAAAPSTTKYYPTSDVTVTGFTRSSDGNTTNIYTMIDEPTTASDADYITTADNPPSGSVYECAFANVGTPSVDTGHVIKYRMFGAGGQGCTVGLYQGTTLIKSWTHNPIDTTFTTYTQTLSEAEASGITDYSNLRIRWTTI